ncbi:tetratricopeptide repeat protein [Hoeflea sp. TYP-13]|uniref:tetratricopeptide repeat protein n=1 Tax=Hoeflea sp. TYP-13 TaxID=3230023 RepID=UPI0034C6C79B
MKMRHLTPIALAVAVLSFSQAAAQDKFGQTVPAALEKKVLEARQMRLPYRKEVYDPKESARMLEEVIAVKPDYYRAHFNLGLTYHELDDYEKSTESFDRAIKIQKEQGIDDATLFNTAGWVSLKNGDFRRAELLLKRAETMTKGTNTYTEGAVHGNLGQLYFLTQRFDEAQRHLTISRDEFGSKESAYYLDLIDKTQKVLVIQEQQIMKRLKTR